MFAQSMARTPRYLSAWGIARIGRTRAAAFSIYDFLHMGSIVCPLRTCSTLPSRLPLVSSFGRVRSKDGIVSRGTPVREGYFVTRIGGQRKMVHRLVARAFLGAPPSLAHSDVHHKDGRRYNNCVDNLEYATRRENVSDSWTRRDRQAKALMKAVLARRCGQDEWSHYPSISGAAKSLDLYTSSICRVCNGLRKSTAGYEFQYAQSTPGVLPDEEWRAALHPHSGTPLGTLSVSSHGRVISKRGLVSLGSLTCGGYRSVACSVDRKKHTFYVHRLVARTFLGPSLIPSPWHVNHKDNDRSNNCIANLEYATPADNAVHWLEMAARMGYPRHGYAKPLWGRLCGSRDWMWFRSCREAGKHFNVSRARIVAVCRGEDAPEQKYEFRFDDRLTHPVEPEVLRGEEWMEMNFDI